MSIPDLSVVVPSTNGLEDLSGCLAALAAQEGDLELEILVPDRLGSDLRDAIRESSDSVKLIEMDARATIPQMRAAAFDAAESEAVAVIEDHVIVPPGWARSMLAALAEGASVVGGSIENAAEDTLVDRAAFLCEYSDFLLPLSRGSVGGLPGNNVVYRKQVLDRFSEKVGREQWEHALHEAMRAEGIELICRPEIVVGHKKHYRFTEYLSQRYLYSRSFAGGRLVGAGLSRTWLYRLGGFLLPPLLLIRILSRIAKKKTGWELLEALPLIAVFICSWAWGEIVGYWAGPGDSLSRVC